ncbi:MAG: hypothetical protein M3Y30_13110 [Gemmatimonadota bacterium]|nr:hypothetical protein [Gemmatimonadota bacterium]
MQPSSSRGIALQRQFKSLVTENLPVKFSALFFAVVLWVIVRSEEPSEAWIDVHLALTLDSTVTMGSQPPSVQALVSGRGRELLKLYSALPELRRSIGEDDTVFAVHPADVFTSNEADVKVLDVRPHLVRLPLARVAPVAVRPRRGNKISP